MINISPIKYDKYDCYQNNIIGQTSKYWSFNHLPVLWSGLDFCFTDNQSQTLEKFEFRGSNASDHDTLRDFCGLIIQNCSYNNFDDFLKIIETELIEDIPVAIAIDSYHIKWSENYQKYFRKHFLLISGIDEINNEFLCCDGYLNAEICNLDINHLFQKQEAIKIFKRIEVKQKGLNESLIYLRNVIQANNPKKSEHIQNFASCILNYWNVDISSLPIDMAASNFLFFLTKIYWNRNSLIKGLRYFHEEFQSNIFINIISDLDAVCVRWDMLKSLYTKSIITGKKSILERAIDILFLIDEEEEKITERILLICEEK